MADRIQVRRDTDADWTSNDPTLAAGEIGFVSDTNKLVVGDGSTAFTSLEQLPIAPSVTSWTPTLTATVTNPTRQNGTGGVIEGSYLQVGPLVHVWVRIVAGSTGIDGSGVYIVDLPVSAADPADGQVGSTAVAAGAAIGTGFARDNDASGNSMPLTVQLRSADAVWLIDGNGDAVTDASPWAGFAANDVLSFYVTYLAV